MAWDELIGPVLEEFDYEHEGIAVRWHLAGAGVPIVIDPRVSFGAPSVRGTPTWIIKGRYDAGESDSAIAEDFRGLLVDGRFVRQQQLEVLQEAHEGAVPLRVRVDDLAAARLADIDPVSKQRHNSV